MKKKIIFFLLAISCSGYLLAQEIFVTKGKIEYERKTNIHRLYYPPDESGGLPDQLKKLIPQFKVDYFDLIFSGDQSIYQPGRESDGNRNAGFFFQAPAAANVVYKDLAKQLYVGQKQIFESRFLITDSLRNISWKILPETRSIGQFTCRKAVGRICDSVVVVAFYTDEIIPSNGPESFGGLPGMILELAIPRLYTTWIATKVELWQEEDSNALHPPGKGRKASNEELESTINAGIKDWGEKYRDRSLWFASL